MSNPVLLTNIEIADVIKSFLPMFVFEEDKSCIKVHTDDSGFQYIRTVPIHYAFMRRFTDGIRREDWKATATWWMSAEEDIGQRSNNNDWACKVYMGRDMQDISINPKYDLARIEKLVRQSDDNMPYIPYPEVPEYLEYRMKFKFGK
jgi:hypothetical protein